MMDGVKLFFSVGNFFLVFFGFLMLGGFIIDGIRQGDYTFPIFLIVVLLISWPLLPKTPKE